MSLYPTLNVHRVAPLPDGGRRKASYLWHRYAKGLPAVEAWIKAGADLKARYLNRNGGLNPRHEGRAWVEDYEDNGIRFVDFADELAGCIRHQGWFADDFQDEIIRGAVYQLPARKGCAQYVAGYEDPNNKGCAMIDFSEIFEGDRGGLDGYHYELGVRLGMSSAVDQDREYSVANDESVLRDAAIAADGIAARDAEVEREYREASSKRSEYEDLKYDEERIRNQISALNPNGNEYLLELRDDLEVTARRLKREAEELWNEWSDRDGFQY